MNLPNNDLESWVARPSVEVFVGAMAKVLSDFKRVPLDDRDAAWILRRVQEEVGSSDATGHLTQDDVATVQFLSQLMNRLVLRWDQIQGSE